MIIMGSILGTLFVGVTLLANKYGIIPHEHETVLSQLGKNIFSGGFLYYLLQFSTCAILLLAGNTPFADFPRLCSVMARDGYLPRQLANKGDRLVFSNGIILLSLLASALVVIFKGDTHLLIPLYAVGVFLAFTLSQTGMVVHWFKLRTRGWTRSAFFNGLGGITTAVVLIIIASTKFVHGAWIVVITIPIIVYATKQINLHYKQVAEQLSIENISEKREKGYKEHFIIVPISGVHASSLKALQYAKTLTGHVIAVYVSINPSEVKKVQEKWDKIDIAPLVILPSPYRSVLESLKQYIDKLAEENPESIITVVISEFVPRKWWHNLLHNQTGLIVSRMLLYNSNVIVSSVPMHLEK
jgi:cobalamin biosynthesis protein CobD/CbiB